MLQQVLQAVVLIHGLSSQLLVLHGLKDPCVDGILHIRKLALLCLLSQLYMVLGHGHLPMLHAFWLCLYWLGW